MKIELGQEVKDRVTGFRGIAISRTSYLQGCDRIAVQPTINESNVDIEHPTPRVADFDEPDLIVTGIGVLPEEVTDPDDRGGPRRTPDKAR